MGKKKRSYTISKKRETLDAVTTTSQLEAAKKLGIPRRTIRDWVDQEESIRAFKGSERSPTLIGQGKRELFPFAHGLYNYIKVRRCDEKIVSTKHMIQYIKHNHPRWLISYMNNKKSIRSGLNALERACQRFCGRYFAKPQTTKKNVETLAATHLEFALNVWEEFGKAYKLSEIYNVEETGIDFDRPPNKMWVGKGRRDSAKMFGLDKHSTRLTAVLTARADGKKLPILFVVRGKPGGSIEAKELKKYPKEHVYAVQDNAWMNARVLKIYASELLIYEINNLSLLLLDNF
ncbi:hypothetical protein PF005_g6564 [Phytophthora fragariae]|uniref:HTH psq-type domain-containing protein n=1 Tax=Phytophthora fragariae TaxID=53985 RepID=A0A6A3YR33_9STRA|nr:hypothetical protein PF011_g5646 [Phytophthora fragariae]KAE9222771.1 hypothetical protein PF005_g6564 [Phytophthora fragariae]KAE9244887.1 hypothetical protein PF004_g5486 [Phytophthora fragariae]